MNIQQYIEEFDHQLDNRACTIALSLSTRKPKLKVSKVPEDLRTVQIVLNFPVVEHGVVLFYVRHNLAWSLNDQHISPVEYITMVGERLGIPPEHRKPIERDLIFQLIDYIEKHSYEFDEPEPQQHRNPEKRRPGRPVKIKQPVQTTMPVPPPLPPKPTSRLSMRSNMNCLNCQFMNTQASYECKRCKLPFVLLEQLNLLSPIVQVCLNLYELTLLRVGNLAFAARNRKITSEDFTSLYVLRDRLREAIQEDEYATLDSLVAQIMKNKGPLPIERTNLIQRRMRSKREEATEDHSGNNSQEEK